MDLYTLNKSRLVQRLDTVILETLLEAQIEEEHLKFDDYFLELGKLIIQIDFEKNHSLITGPIDEHLMYIISQLRSKLIALKAEDGNEVNRDTAERIIAKYVEPELHPISNGYFILSSL